jgi:ubiquinone/menaquinone biosynthesis C-methylase UbiE
LTEESTAQLEFTGERFTPECVREIWYEHMHRYVLAGELLRGRKVLDAACGEGFGAFHLAAGACQVTAVDISPETIQHAAARYRRDNLSFQVADCRALPFADGQFDCIVSFETLEHLEEQAQMLAEFRRVLAGDGFLLISSPDKAVYSGQMKNDNPFHVRELYRQELEDLLAREFPVVRLLGHKLAFHSMIWQLDEPGGGKATGPENLHLGLQRERDGMTSRLSLPGGDAVYFIALCAAGEKFLPTLQEQVWLFDDAAESVYRHYHHEIRKNMQAGEILQARDREIEALKSALQQQQLRQEAPWWRRLFGR